MTIHRTPPRPNLFERITRRVSRKLRRYRKSPITYQYKAFSIELPPHHQLPEHQKRHPKYDRFLPHLARCVDPAETIVDIGANVGDTLAGMVEQNARPTYVCIEPDDAFHCHLENNVERMRSSVSGLRVEIIKALVGKNVSNVVLVGERGTKHAVASGPGGIESSPLDELIGPGHKVRLLKSDVDGFDYDVLDSSMAIISRDGPMIFFECQYENEHQLVAYRRRLESLECAGYATGYSSTISANYSFARMIWTRSTSSWTTSGVRTPGVRRVRSIAPALLTVRKDYSKVIDKVLSEYIQLAQWDEARRPHRQSDEAIAGKTHSHTRRPVTTYAMPRGEDTLRLSAGICHADVFAIWSIDRMPCVSSSSASTFCHTCSTVTWSTQGNGAPCATSNLHTHLHS